MIAIQELLEWYSNTNKHLTAVEVMDYAYKLKDREVENMAKLLQHTRRAMYNLSDEDAKGIVYDFIKYHKKLK